MATTTHVIGDYTAANSIDGSTNYLLIQPGSSSTAYNKINRNVLLGVTGQPMDISSVQSVTNKSLDNSNTLAIRDDRFTLQDSGDVTKQAQFQLSGITTGTTRTYTLPNASSTLADIATAQTLINKTLTSPAITGGTIDQSTITVDAIAGHTTSNTGTAYGIAITGGTISSAALASGAVTFSKIGQDSSFAWGSYTPTTTGLTLTGGTLKANYIQLGKTVTFKVSFLLGSGSAVTGSPTFTLPVPATSFYAVNSGMIGLSNFVNTGSADYLGSVRLNSTTACGVLIIGSSGLSTAVSSSAPFSFTSGSLIVLQATYEAA